MLGGTVPPGIPFDICGPLPLPPPPAAAPPPPPGTAPHGEGEGAKRARLDGPATAVHVLPPQAQQSAGALTEFAAAWEKGTRDYVGPGVAACAANPSLRTGQAEGAQEGKALPRSVLGLPRAERTKRTIYLTGIHPAADEDTVKQVLAAHGEVVAMQLHDPARDHEYRYAFVELATEEGAQAACRAAEAKEIRLCGRLLRARLGGVVTQQKTTPMAMVPPNLVTPGTATRGTVLTESLVRRTVTLSGMSEGVCQDVERQNELIRALERRFGRITNYSFPASEHGLAFAEFELEESAAASIQGSGWPLADDFIFVRRSRNPILTPRHPGMMHKDCLDPVESNLTLAQRSLNGDDYALALIQQQQKYFQEYLARGESAYEDARRERRRRRHLRHRLPSPSSSSSLAY